MKFITLEQTNQLLLVTLLCGKVNAINHEMLIEINKMLDEADKDPKIEALVFASASPKFFSPGFDVAEVFSYDQDQMTSFFGTFVEMVNRLVRFSKPTIAAIGGHAYAGGAILALACDFRVMAKGSYGFALNEIKLGFAVPASMVRMVENAVGVVHARHLLLLGQPIDPQQAHRIGLAFELVEPDELQSAALNLASQLAEKAPDAYRGIKSALRTSFEHADAPRLQEEVSQFIEHWFSPAAEQQKRKLTESMNHQ